MEKILSIIIPTYNMEKYLHHCLDSLIVPTKYMELLDVIVVNDGSKDTSLTIMNEYAKKYPQTFRIIDKPNGGHGSCCNIGLKEAKGRYIHFLDSDDWFDDHLPEYIQMLCKEQADVVLTKKVTEMASTGMKHVNMYPSMEYNKLYYIDEVNYNLHNNWTFNLHCCSFNTKKLRQANFSFREKCSYDDMILSIIPYETCDSFTIYDLNIYHYFVGRDGQSMDRNVLRKKYPQLNVNGGG